MKRQKPSPSKSRSYARKRYSIPIVVGQFVPERDDIATAVRIPALPVRSWGPPTPPRRLFESESFLPHGHFTRRTEDVPADKLQTNLKRFLEAMEAALSGIPASLDHYHLDTVEIEVEVSAEGSVSLLGTGGKLGGKGSLTLKLQRR